MNNHLNQQNNNSYTCSVSKSSAAAKAILATAQHEADELVSAAKIEAEKILSEAKTKCKQDSEKLQTTKQVSTLLAWRNAVLTAKDDIISVVEYLTKSLLLNELTSTPESILNRIEAATEIIEDMTAITLEVSKNDISFLSQRKEITNLRFKLIVNHSLKLGEFILKTKRSEIKSSPIFHLENLILEFGCLTRSFRQLAKITNCQVP